MRPRLAGALLTFLIASGVVAAGRQTVDATKDLDARVSAFLQQHRNDWHDLNVPEADGQQLYDLVLKNGYKTALEIGTSTGRSGIYIAWAVAKNGGKLVTIDIDEGRHAQAVQHFKDAGVSAYVDARLGDAHDIVAKAVLPKLRAGGCLATHNVYAGRGRRGSNGDYYEFMTSLPYMENSLASGGLLVSYKRRDK
jgi:caffeoyl-CoA O-methyltransferase